MKEGGQAARRTVIGGGSPVTHRCSWPPAEGQCGCAAAGRCAAPPSAAPPAPTPGPGRTLASAAARSRDPPAWLEGETEGRDAEGEVLDPLSRARRSGLLPRCCRRLGMRQWPACRKTCWMRGAASGEWRRGIRTWRTAGSSWLICGGRSVSAASSRHTVLSSSMSI